MSDYNGLRPGQVLADASVADFISSLGLGIARAQQALDTNSIEQLDAFIQPIPGLGGKTLIEMGFSPAFYHYQHADISCSMNLHLRVEESTGVDFGINGAYNNAETSNDDSDSSSSSSSSGSRSETRNREASLQITAQSAGEVRINDNRVALSGADLESRLASLVDGLAGNADISAVAFERSETPINPTTDASPQQVIVSPNAVAFRAFGYAGGVIRIASNSDTTFVANPDTSLSVTRSNSVANYARKVKTAFEDAGFEVTHWPPGEPIHEVLFDIDRNHIRADQRDALQENAQMLARAGVPFRLVGHADAPASPGYNLGLSQRRVDEVERQLIANGVDRAQITSAAAKVKPPPTPAAPRASRTIRPTAGYRFCWMSTCW
ncbi:OmpA family protein [Halopseudomonas pachastrellae]|nr:OmpA family protein [Halopseudomonas pachastrellae]